MSIKADVTELEAIKMEIKHLTARKKVLKEREKQIEARIAQFLKSKDQIGVKHHNMAVIIEEKEVSGPKKMKERDADAINVLAQHGIKDPDKVFAELMNARKGDKMVTEKLSVKKIKTKTV
ncbi:MAG: hypothetical protein JSS09_09045 [Verrucomicrobia bacterium]|nr:hypothetical protein [Verrucomicrobiota bacterium]